MYQTFSGGAEGRLQGADAALDGQGSDTGGPVLRM